jgi:hypothetical protein
MIDEEKVLKHSKEACYVGITGGAIFSLFASSIEPLLVGGLFSLLSMAKHYDLKRFIKKEQNQ